MTRPDDRVAAGSSGVTASGGEPATRTATDEPTTDICTSIAMRVADEVGVPPEELQPPLYELVDPDALETLLRSDGNRTFDGSVVFDAYGCTITVAGDGRVSVEPGV